jgi:hypothetical protein
MTRTSLPSPEKLAMAAAKDYSGAEISVSFPDRWQLVQRLPPAEMPRYVAGFPPRSEKPRSDHFFGLPAEINRSLSTYRLYNLFEPWPTPLLQVAFWQVVERDMGVNRIFTQPHEPTFKEGYTEFLSGLGYSPDPDFGHWWSKRSEPPSPP